MVATGQRDFLRPLRWFIVDRPGNCRADESCTWLSEAGVFPISFDKDSWNWAWRAVDGSSPSDSDASNALSFPLPVKDANGPGEEDRDNASSLETSMVLQVKASPWSTSGDVSSQFAGAEFAES